MADVLSADVSADVSSADASSPIRLEDVWAEHIPVLAKRERYQKILEFIYFLRDNEEFQETNAVCVPGNIEVQIYNRPRNIIIHIGFDAVKIQGRERGAYSLAFYTSNTEVADFDGRCMWVSGKYNKSSAEHTYARLMNFDVSYPVFIKGKR